MPRVGMSILPAKKLTWRANLSCSSSRWRERGLERRAVRNLTIVYHHAGGGHRSAADALQATLSTHEQPWNVSLLDIQELLDPIDLIRRATGLRIQDTYNLILRRGWTRFTPQLLVILRATIRSYHGPIVK